MSTRRVTADVKTVLAAVPNPPVVSSSDAVLAALADAHGRRMRAEEEIRLLLAYGRQFVYPHPYTFGELASAAGMSVSGVRTAYGQQDVDKVAAATGLEPVPSDGEES
ncbi:hypothetical protein [Catellatospora sichuanensis]|uniref:hypothetical protein n=1 Tax=Catellatospora sichuanensis TaxID=1969805 RepID=UPI001FE861E3|nr:hypothetical protein [Catellatospora sichuanensis]